ncbi:hypothetical protein [Yokenella regensburgei]
MLIFAKHVVYSAALTFYVTQRHCNLTR